MKIKPEGVIGFTTAERELLRYGLVLVELTLNNSGVLFDIDAASDEGVLPSDLVRMLRIRAENPTKADGSIELQGNEPLLAWVALTQVVRFEEPHIKTSPDSAKRFATATTLSSQLGSHYGLPPRSK